MVCGWHLDHALCLCADVGKVKGVSVTGGKRVEGMVVTQYNDRHQHPLRKVKRLRTHVWCKKMLHR